MSFERGYYGASTSVYHYMGLPKKEFMGSAPGCYHILAPDCDACPVGTSHPGCSFACLEVSERRLEAAGARDQGVAALLFEPILSAGGMLFPPPGYLERLAEMAARLGALLISNEVTTGAGRTGRWFAYQHSSVTPDAIVFGKGFGNGLPVAGVLVRADVEEAAHAAGLVHIQSHQSDPLSGFVVTEVVRLVRELGLLERAQVLGEELKAGIESVSRTAGGIKAVRGLGFMAAFTTEEDGPRFHAELARRRVITCYRPAYDTFQLMPALTMSRQELAGFVEVLKESLDTVRKIRRASEPS